jgi:hypothetical protein
MLIRELFIQEKKQEYCNCSCDCGKPVCESCGKKHKKDKIKEYADAGTTSSGNIASGPAYKNNVKRDKNGVPKAKQALNKDGTAKNGLDMGGSGLISGGSWVKR